MQCRSLHALLAERRGADLSFLHITLCIIDSSPYYSSFIRAMCPPTRGVVRWPIPSFFHSRTGLLCCHRLHIASHGQRLIPSIGHLPHTLPHWDQHPSWMIRYLLQLDNNQYMENRFTCPWLTNPSNRHCSRQCLFSMHAAGFYP